MNRTRKATQLLAEFSNGNESLEALWVDLRRFWNEGRTFPQFLQNTQIFVEVSRVTPIVLTRTKLNGIDKDGHDNMAGNLPRLAHQAQMAGMQGSHCRHERGYSPIFSQF